METQVRLEQWKATKQSTTFANQNIDDVRPERGAVDEGKYLSSALQYI